MQIILLKTYQVSEQMQDLKIEAQFFLKLKKKNLLGAKLEVVVRDFAN